MSEKNWFFVSEGRSEEFFCLRWSSYLAEDVFGGSEVNKKGTAPGVLMQSLEFWSPREVFKDFPRLCGMVKSDRLAIEEEGWAVDESPGQVLNADRSRVL